MFFHSLILKKNYSKAQRERHVYAPIKFKMPTKSFIFPPENILLLRLKVLASKYYNKIITETLKIYVYALFFQIVKE